MSNEKKNWFQGNGFLSEEGKRMLIDFRDALDNILSKDEVREMTFAQVQTLGSNLHKMVGDAISDRISNRMQFANNLEKMTDEQFEAYLEAKYGNIWRFITLNPEELARVRPLTDEQIKKAMQPDDRCTGHMWRDEFGNESFTHGEYDFCPVCDVKNK